MKWARFIGVSMGALIITALGIDAADTMRGSQGTLLSQVINMEKGECSKGMISVSNIDTLTCVDAFEASTGDKCPVQTPENVLGSVQNLESSLCVPESSMQRPPWRFITREQAMRSCARVGKRLPTSAEWYALALGLSSIDASCNVNKGQVARTGEHDACVTPQGAYDLVGNVWEWVSDDIMSGKYRDSNLPDSGYVTQVDADGMAIATGNTEDPLFNADYFWSRSDGTFGVIRGGYYDSGSDAGIYSVHADTLPTTASPGIGFRCVK
jgi:hypothetical protein